MALPILSPHYSEWQDAAGEEGMETCEEAALKENPRDILSRYKWVVERACFYRRKLKNPVNKSTGKPLKEASIKVYSSKAELFGKKTSDTKAAIRLLILYGYIRNDKTRARWIRDRIGSGADDDIHYEGLNEKEVRFVNLYSRGKYAGSGVMALRNAGFVGSYITLRTVWIQLLREQHIKKAFKLRATYIMKRTGLMVVAGGGQGDGKPHKVKPDRITDPKNIPMLSYIRDFYNRLNSRREFAWDRCQELIERYGYDSVEYGRLDMHRKWILELQTEVYDLDRNPDDWTAERKKYDRVHEKLTEVEKELRILRGNYFGW